MDRAIRITVLAAACLAVLAPSASAQSIPPGNSGADQYTEGVPGAGGNHPSAGGSDGSGGGSGGSALSESTISQLETSGSTGVQAAQILGSTAPRSKELRDAVKSGDASGHPSDVGSSDTRGDSGLAAAVGEAVSGTDDGMGPVLPILLLLVAVGAVGLAAWRRFGSAGPPAQS